MPQKNAGKRGLRLSAGGQQADSPSVPQEQPRTDATENGKPETPKAKETSGANHASSETPDDSPKKGESSRQTESGDARHETKTSEDKTASASKSENRQRQDYYRTYVGKDEPGESSDATGAKQERRDTLNRAGVDRVLEHERNAGRNPTEMPHTHPGYDIESRNPSGEIARFIEVKSCPGDWDRKGVALSKTQFEKAMDEGNKFWLYVVERAEAENFNIIRIQNPGRLVNQFFYDDGWREVGE